MKKICLPVLFFCIIGISYGKNDAPAVTLLNYTGKITINNKNITDVGHPVRYGDVIKTGALSVCDILVNEKSIIRLWENTALTYKVSEKENRLILDSGYIAAVTRKKFTKSGVYIVQTPTVSASVRGTSFCVKVENAKSVYFCVCNGKIDLAARKGGKKITVESAHHTAQRFVKKDDGSITVEKNAGLLYHNDEGLEKLAAAIDEKIDWTKPDER
ncbi:MAG TPA: FecR family protein [Spirochaetota bacterium]